jgi:D-arabinose 1-dehydrogenase-like Zn-dependent alcohol dehydrogenase
LNGAFAEYFKMPSENLFPISPSVPLEQVAAMSDGVATSWHAVRRQADVQPGQTVAIVGVGGLGVHGTQMTRLSGARTIVVDVVQEKLDLAQRLGADVAIDARSGDVPARVMELTAGLGVDAVLDFVTEPDTVEMGLQMLRRGGVLVLVGLAPGRPFTVDSVDTVLSEKRIVGSRTSSKQDLVDVIRLVEQGKITPIVGQHFRLEEANQALDALRRGEAMGRMVIVPREESHGD